MSTIPDSFAFAVSPDGRQFAIWEPGNEPWFAPEPAMNGRWITSADMDRLGWTRYTPQTADGRAEVLREAAEVSAQWKSDCQSCAVELEVAGELRRLADEAGEEKATPGFFRPGRTYTYQATGFTAPELIVYFRPEHITRHPEHGHLRAIGWSRTGEPGAKWHGDFYDEFDGWTQVTGDGAREKDTAPSGESTPADLTVYRASHDSIVMGLYTTAAAAREHCETEERRSWPKGTTLAFDWIEDEEDGVAELTVVAGQNEEGVTGYVVTALTVASKYDEEADA